MKRRKKVETRTINKIEFALVPVAQYTELLEYKRLWEAHGIRKMYIEHRPRSLIDQDPALASFFADRLNKMGLAGALAECEAEFGAERTPSSSALQRYWSRLRVDRARERVQADG